MAARRLINSTMARQFHRAALSPASRMLPRADAMRGVSMLKNGPGYAYNSVSQMHSGRGFLSNLWHEHWDAFRNVAIDYGFVKMEPVYQVFRLLFLISFGRLYLGEAGLPNREFPVLTSKDEEDA